MTLMSAQGVEATSVSQIVKRARSSVGSFYARFEGKDDFVRYLEARVWRDATERWDEAVERVEGRDLTTPQLVSGVVRLLVETNRDDLERRRVLGEASGSTRRAADFHDHVLDGVWGILRPKKEEFAHPAPRQAVAFGYRVIAGALHELPTLREGVEGWGQEALVSELTRVYLAYLGSDADPPAPRVLPDLPPGDWRTEELAVAEAYGLEGVDVSAETLEPIPAAAESQSPPKADPSSAPQQPVETDTEDEEEGPERVDFFDVWG